MKKGLLTLLIFCVGTIAYAQNSILFNYEWEDSPSKHELTEEELNESQVYIKHLVANEIFYTADNSAIEYYMEHIIKHVNDEEAIDASNKVYLPGSMADPDEYTIVEKARVIKANGKVTDLDINDILEEEDEETGRTYRYFALEGLEVGDEIEYLYLYPRSPRTTGILRRLQTSDLKKEASLWIITPKNLINKFKSFNGFPEMERDSTHEDINFFRATYSNMPGLREEKFADYTANLAGVAYYLYENTANGTTTDYYSNVSKYLATSFNEINPKKTGVTKFIKKMGMDKTLKKEDQIRFVDNYIKTEIRYIENGLDGLSDLKVITSRKYANDMGLAKLYGAIFNQLDIKYEVVFTTDRSDLPFDEDFECGIYLDETMLYFPKYKKYLAVAGLGNRYGFPPTSYTNNYGYFTRFLEVGGLKSGVGKTKFIEPVSADQTMDEFTVELDLEFLPMCNAELTKKLTGYDALMYQTIIGLLDEESKEEFTEQIVKYIDEDMEIVEMELKNTDAQDAGVKPLLVDATFTSDIFVQKAGNNYLINVGKMIGPQSEMYEDEERVLPITHYTNKVYKRTLIVNIPEGYEVANLEKLAMDISFDQNGDRDMGFVSSYTLEGSVLKITCEEYYYTMNYPIERYEDFKKVINAAADFNKIAILLKKK